MDDSENDRLREEAAELDRLFYALMEDVRSALALWEERDDEFSRSTYVRSVFTLVEGTIQMMKRAAILFDHFNSPRLLSHEEVVLLREEEVFLKSNGKATTRSTKVSLLSNFRFSLGCYARVMDIDFSPDIAGQGWEYFQQAKAIRDRLTHPKSVSDLSVTEREIKVVEAGMQYFRESTGPLLHQL